MSPASQPLLAASNASTTATVILAGCAKLFFSNSSCDFFIQQPWLNSIGNGFFTFVPKLPRLLFDFIPLTGNCQVFLQNTACQCQTQPHYEFMLVLGAHFGFAMHSRQSVCKAMLPET
jgi:hypothetical protein